MILGESGGASKSPAIGSGLAFAKNVGFPILFLAVSFISCTTGGFRAQSKTSPGAGPLNFFSPAIAGNINSIAVSYYGLVIERALRMGNGDFEIDISDCGRLDSLLAFNSFFAEESNYDNISSAIDSINIDIYQGGLQVGKIEIREFAGSFIGLVKDFDCDTLMAVGNITAIAGEYDLFGERMSVRHGSMKFSSSICDECERVLTILSERNRAPDTKSVGPRKKIYSKIATEDAANLHFSTDYAYLVSDMEVAFSGATMVAEFTTYSLFDNSLNADSAFSIASIFLTVDLQRNALAATRQECITLTFDPRLNLISTDIELIDLLQ